ncbi:MAG: type I 3-dehydroquinate dehydratase [Lachnospiraceae bacterium]|nr:type I 3-dehydroquinate dehydratase [Lachnospiraceae bacterium]
MKKIKPVIVGNLEIGTGIPKICAPIMGTSNVEILEQVRRIRAAAPDLVEFRGDVYENVLDYDKLKEIIHAVFDILGDIPLLFTFRSAAEGGNRPISTDDYVNLNQMVSELEEVKMIDVEVYMDLPKMGALIGAIHKNGKMVIGSNHRFDRTPPRSEMIAVLKTLELNGADIVKLAVMPTTEGDVRNLIQTTNEATCDYLNRPAVTMAMGDLGIASRIGGEIFGSCITFGCVGKTSAPGQIPVDTLRQQLEDLHNIVEKI